MALYLDDHHHFCRIVRLSRAASYNDSPLEYAVAEVLRRY
jgi:hypothetical protein